MVGRSRREDVEGEKDVGVTRRYRVRDVVRVLENLEVGDDGAALLTESRLIEARDVFVLESRGGGKKLVGGDDAGATDTNHVDVCLFFLGLRPR